MKSLNLYIGLIMCIFILYYIIKNVTSIGKNIIFMSTDCKKGLCHNISKCYSVNGYTYSDTGSDKLIERKTLKCVLNTDDKEKLVKLDNIFVPSMMNETFCDILYTTYYDYNDFTLLKNRVYNLNMPLTKCIRIRRYYFQPGIYFEIKYNGGLKVRALINENYDLLESDKIEEEYKDAIVSALDKIRSKKVNPIFQNTYKRLSFIYKNNPSMRLTIDTNIEYFHNNIYKKMENDILEFKVPYSVSLVLANEYLNEINQLAGTNLIFTPFSKFEYYYYNVILKQN